MVINGRHHKNDVKKYPARPDYFLKKIVLSTYFLLVFNLMLSYNLKSAVLTISAESRMSALRRLIIVL